MQTARRWKGASYARLFTFVFLTVLACSTRALPTAVLSNVNQPSVGGFLTLTSLGYVAVPFVTDSRFTRLEGVEITAATLLTPGNVFVQIWDVDAFGEPGNVVGTLSGPTDPTGLSQYTGTVDLQPERSYFLVIGIGNGAGTLGTAVFAIDGNGVDSQPSPVYRIGTDFNGDGAINFVNKCLGSTVSSGSVSWTCAGLAATRFFPKFRLLAEEPAPTLPPVPPSLTSTPLFLDFGTVTQGVTSAPLVATIENNGGGDQVLGSIGLVSGARFAVGSDTCSGATLAPGATCTVGVTFTPDSGGQFSDTVIIPVPADPSAPYGLPVVGEGDIPPNQSLTTSPAGLDFGAVDQGVTSSALNLQVENNGNVNQALGTLTITGPFALTSDACSGATLTPGATCSVAVTFSPLAAGLAGGTLSIPASGDAKSPYSVPLSGEGNPLPPVYSLISSPSFLDFGTVTQGMTSTALIATIENNGNIDQALGGLSLASGVRFAISSDACSGVTLVPGANCTVGVTFTPDAGGQFSDTILIPSPADPASPYGLQVVGEGDIPPNQSLTTSPAGLDFGLVDQGTTSPALSLQVENNGNVDQTLGTLTATGNFALATDTCSGTTLTSGMTCSVSVTFSPVSAGLAGGTLQIPAAGDVKSPYSVPLSGQGIATTLIYSLTSTPLFLDFGQVADGTTSAPQTAVIENDGDLPQMIGTVSAESGFVVASDGCSGINLAPGATCTISLTFSPTHGGINSGTAIIPASTDPRSPYGLALTGESDQPGVALPSGGGAMARPVPLRFTLATGLGLVVVAGIWMKRG